MNDERRKVEQLYRSVLERTPGERSAFLSTACQGDDDLRREVETLLAHEATAGTFLTTSAAETTGFQASDDARQTLIGLLLGA